MAEFNDNQFYLYPPFRHAPMWSPSADHVIPVVSPVGMGPKGEQGEPGRDMVFEDLTESQLEEIYSHSAFAVNKSENALFVTSSTNTTFIPIPINDFDSFDILFVDVEGIMLAEGTDYMISGDNIVLTQPITHSGVNVHFRALSYDLPTGEDKSIAYYGQAIVGSQNPNNSPVVESDYIGQLYINLTTDKVYVSRSINQWILLN